ncbi:hypothetical protein [Zunongwangia sp.]|uniref:hypothetical protein n=1 Tax=Zunongwangia sp. TaxID=1965325 RepID=UPI003AA835F6
MKKFERIWYACYGSNLMQDRFLCYIGGGTPKGAKQTYKGCTDKSLPKENRSYLINHELYFAKSAKTWSGGGAAFIKPTPSKGIKTFSKIYNISKDQFIDLVKQEIGIEGELKIDLEKVIEHGYIDLDTNVWYNRILFLGFQEEMPVFSFTNANFLKNEVNQPHPSYLEKIILGLRETYQFTSTEIKKYLETKIGIENTTTANKLESLLSEVIND